MLSNTSFDNMGISHNIKEVLDKPLQSFDHVEKTCDLSSTVEDAGVVVSFNVTPPVSSTPPATSSKNSTPSHNIESDIGLQDKDKYNILNERESFIMQRAIQEGAIKHSSAGKGDENGFSKLTAYGYEIHRDNQRGSYFYGEEKILAKIQRTLILFLLLLLYSLILKLKF